MPLFTQTKQAIPSNLLKDKYFLKKFTKIG